MYLMFGTDYPRGVSLEKLIRPSQTTTDTAWSLNKGELLISHMYMRKNFMT